LLVLTVAWGTIGRVLEAVEDPPYLQPGYISPNRSSDSAADDDEADGEDNFGGGKSFLGFDRENDMTRRQLLEGGRLNEQFQIEVPERWVSTTRTSDDEREVLQRLQVEKRWRGSLNGGGRKGKGSVEQNSREEKKNRDGNDEESETDRGRVPLSSAPGGFSAAPPSRSPSSSTKGVGRKRTQSSKKGRTKRRKA